MALTPGTRLGVYEIISPTIASPAMTQAGMMLGPAAYMSPEQAKGRPVDRRADIWRSAPYCTRCSRARAHAKSLLAIQPDLGARARNARK